MKQFDSAFEASHSMAPLAINRRRHLRRDIDPDMEVDVEVLDLNDEEARTLLLSLDPLADLAETHRDFYDRLRSLAPDPPPELDDLWQMTANGPPDDKPTSRIGDAAPLPAQFLVLIECRDEKQQVEFLERFQHEGIPCRALVG